MDSKKIALIEKNLKALSGKNAIAVDKEIELIEKHGVDIVSIDEERYPENLKNIYDPPPVLYVLGGLKPEDSYNIAIVGSRRASLYGLQQAEKLGRQLAENGVTVTSGMARGIDTGAHRGALKAGGRTIAVLGCGVNIVYPPENRELKEKIQNNGAVISEFPMNTAPLKHNFPIRNRIISGLSLGVVVCEAAEKSGALITVSCALDEGREVFSLPGRVDMPTSKGTLGLIKDGAKLVQDVSDILEEINPAHLPARQVKRTPEIRVSSEEKNILDILSHEPVYIDDIAQKSGLDQGKISRVLLDMELKKLIKALPGKMYVKN